MKLGPRYSVFAAALSGLLAFGSALSLIGHPARLVAILTLFAGAFGAGVSIAPARASVRPRPPVAEAQETSEKPL